MEVLLSLDRKVIQWLQFVALIGFIAMMIGAGIVTADALLRTFAGKPIRGLAEIIDISTAIVIATCFPIALAQRRNIRIALLSDRFGSFGNRIFDAIADLVLLVFVTIISIELIRFTIEAIRLGESSLVLHIPAGPFWISASTIMALSIPAQLLVTLISLGRIFVPGPNPSTQGDI